MVLIRLISRHKVTKLLQIHIAYPGQKLIKYGPKVLVLARPETLELLKNTLKMWHGQGVPEEGSTSTRIILRTGKGDCMEFKTLPHSKENNHQCEEIPYRMGKKQK